MQQQEKRQFILNSLVAPHGSAVADDAVLLHADTTDAADETADWSAADARGVSAASNPGFFGVQTPDMLEDMGVQKEKADSRPTLFKRT